MYHASSTGKPRGFEFQGSDRAGRQRHDDDDVSVVVVVRGCAKKWFTLSVGMLRTGGRGVLRRRGDAETAQADRSSMEAEKEGLSGRSANNPLAVCVSRFVIVTHMKWSGRQCK